VVQVPLVWDAAGRENNTPSRHDQSAFRKRGISNEEVTELKGLKLNTPSKLGRAPIGCHEIRPFTAFERFNLIDHLLFDGYCSLASFWRYCNCTNVLAN
jgi:hypothetical protein